MLFRMNLWDLVSLWHHYAYLATAAFGNRGKIGEPKLPFTKATEAISAVIDSAICARSCPRFKDYARFCSTDCRAAKPGWNPAR
jgi:hypothetical protein